MRIKDQGAEPGLFSSSGKAMSLQSVKAEGSLSGLLLDMTVRQNYRNETKKTLETVYTFPLAWGAVLLDLNVEIAGKRLEGVVLERKDAEERYEEAIAEGDSPVMLEKSSDGLYTANLGNLKPGEEAIIEFRFAQLLRYEQGRIRLSVPTTIAPRYGDAEIQGGIKPHEAVETDMLVEYPFELTLTLASDVARGVVESPSHTIQTRCQGDELVVSLVRNAFLDRDFVLTVDGLEGRSMAAIAQDDERHVVLASFCPKVAETARSAISLKILVDCSGSMAGDSIESAKQALHQVLVELDPADRISYSRFGSNVDHAFDRLVTADEKNIRQMAGHVMATDADLGGTETAKALRSVFALGGGEAADVLLITDGEVWDSEGVIEAAKRSGHRVFAVGVGSAPAESLLRSLAEETGGACELLSPNEDIDAACVRMFRRIRNPRAANVQIQWPAQPLWSTPFPSALFDGETIHVFAGFDVPPQAAPVLTFESGSGEPVRVSASTLVRVDDDLLPRMGASARLKVEPESHAREIAMQYRLVTSYTNLFLVHVRAGEDKAQGLPHLQKIAHMQAAGWGGMGSVRRMDRMPSAFMAASSEMRVMRSIEPSSLFNIAKDVGDIPAFLRREVDKEPKVVSYNQAEWLLILEHMLDVVNSELTHPDEFSRFTIALEKRVPIPKALLAMVNELIKLASSRLEAWAAFLAWADRQVDERHRLGRQAGRVVRSHLSSVEQQWIESVMSMLDDRMQKLSTDGWPTKAPAVSAQEKADESASHRPDWRAAISPELLEEIRKSAGTES